MTLNTTPIKKKKHIVPDETSGGIIYRSNPAIKIKGLVGEYVLSDITIVAVTPPSLSLVCLWVPVDARQGAAGPSRTDSVTQCIGCLAAVARFVQI